MTSDFSGMTIPQYASDSGEGDGLVRIQWRNGEQRLKTGGYFFFDRLNGFVPGEPWEPYTDTFNDGSEVEGYKTDTLRMAVLCVRSQPFIWSAPNGTPGRYKIWQPRWQRGASDQGMQVEVLAVVAGFGDEPVVWTSATIKTSFAIVGRGGKGEKPGIIASIREYMVKPAEQAGGVKLDTYCFWAVVETERDDKNRIVYTPTQGKAVTRPVVLLPHEVELPWLREQFCGKKYIAEVLVPLREQYEEWRNERRTNDAEPEPDAAPAQSRNTPAPVGDDDLF